MGFTRGQQILIHLLLTMELHTIHLQSLLLIINQILIPTCIIHPTPTRPVMAIALTARPAIALTARPAIALTARPAIVLTARPAIVLTARPAMATVHTVRPAMATVHTVRPAMATVLNMSAIHGPKMQTRKQMRVNLTPGGRPRTVLKYGPFMINLMMLTKCTTKWRSL